MSKRASKRQKTGSGSSGTKWDINNFASNEAHEGNDVDDFGDEDGFEYEDIGEKEFERIAKKAQSDYDARKRQRTSYSSVVDQIAAKLQRDGDVYDDDNQSVSTVHHGYNNNDTGYNTGYNNQIPMQVTLPGVSDPLLWLVPCLVGRERQCVIKIMERFFKYVNNQSKKIYITTAFTTDMATGHIYVEAYKDVHVRRACEDIPGLNTWKIKLVPRNEMVDALTIKQSAPQVIRGQWCRFKNGLYKGDLGQVYAVIDQGSKCIVKTVPRIDFGRLNIKNNNTNNGKSNMVVYHKKGSRPTQKYFNYNDMCEMGEKKNIDQYQDKLLHNKLIYKWKSKKFKNGFILLSVQINKLDFDITAVPSEVEKLTKKSLKSNNTNSFSDNDDDNSDNDDDNSDNDLLNFPPPILQKTCEFIRGDTVKAIKGSLTNLVGEVVSTQQNKNGETIVYVKPEASVLNGDSVPIIAKNLRKHFKVGCHVKAIRGQYKDETGMIVKVDETRNEIILFSDLTSREIRLNIGDITETSEVSTGRDVFGNYALLELVSLSRDCVGVIVDIQNGQFKILDNKQQIQKVRLTDITRHTQDRHAVALDIDNHQIRIGDIITPQIGEFKGDKATVKHVYRAVLFCHSKRCSLNSGIFVIRSRLSKLGGGTRLKTTNNPLNRLQNSNEGNERSLRILHHHKARRDPWSNKTVRIKMGPHKGYIGIVKSATDLRLSVELHSKAKLVQVRREDVKVINKDGTDVTDQQIQLYSNNNNNNNNNRRNNRDDRRNNNNNRNQFLPNFPVNTPVYENNGGITPGIGASTPAHGITPSHGSATPAVGLGTPGYNETPVYGGITPAHNDNFTPSYNNTGAWGVGDMTPAVGNQTVDINNNNNNDDSDLDYTQTNYNNGIVTPVNSNMGDTPMTHNYDNNLISNNNQNNNNNNFDTNMDTNDFILPNAVVLVNDSNSNKKQRCIVNALTGNMVFLTNIDTNTTVSVQKFECIYIQPTKSGAKIKIISKSTPLYGKTGKLIGRDNSDKWIIEINSSIELLPSNTFVEIK